jgi:hypothetical protein
MSLKRSVSEFAMPVLEPEENKPRLKLELIRGGSGSKSKTAVRLGEPDDDRDYLLELIPRWFNLLLPFERIYFRHLFGMLSPDERIVLLRRARLSRRYRILLSWRWNFYLEENLTQSDAQKLLVFVLPDREPVDFIRTFEDRALWHIWCYWYK